MAMIEIIQGAIKPACYDAYVEYEGPRGKAVEDLLHIDYAKLSTALSHIGNPRLAQQIYNELGVRNRWRIMGMTNEEVRQFKKHAVGAVKG